MVSVNNHPVLRFSIMSNVLANAVSFDKFKRVVSALFDGTTLDGKGRLIPKITFVFYDMSQTESAHSVLRYSAYTENVCNINITYYVLSGTYAVSFKYVYESGETTLFNIVSGLDDMEWDIMNRIIIGE